MKGLKTVLISVISIISIVGISFLSYRIGYCNAYDRYRGASECKPARKLNLFSL